MKLKQAMDADTAAAEIDIMKGVVTEGTGGKAALDDVAVAGKTGTHERGDGSDDSWFVGMAPAADPRSWWPSSSRRANRGLAPVPPTTFWKRLSK